MPTSQIDGAVQTYFDTNRAGRSHSFVTEMIDGRSQEVCQQCHQTREGLKKEPNSFELKPCRGLVG